MDLEKFREYLIDDKYLNESLISGKEFNITVLPLNVLVTKLSKGNLTAVETVVAFIKKYLIVNNCIDLPPPLESEFNTALAMAGFLDCYFKSAGKALGPLHGLPISGDQLERAQLRCNSSNHDTGVLGNIPLSIVFHATLKPNDHSETRTYQPKTPNILFRSLAINSGV